MEEIIYTNFERRITFDLGLDLKKKIRVLLYKREPEIICSNPFLSVCLL